MININQKLFQGYRYVGAQNTHLQARGWATRSMMITSADGEMAEGLRASKADMGEERRESLSATDSTTIPARVEDLTFSHSAASLDQGTPFPIWLVLVKINRQ